MKQPKRVECTIKFFYDPETYLYDENIIPSDEEIFRRCREMMLEDITDQTNAFPIDAISTEFVDKSPQ